MGWLARLEHATDPEERSVVFWNVGSAAVCLRISGLPLIMCSFDGGGVERGGVDCSSLQIGQKVLILMSASLRYNTME